MIVLQAPHVLAFSIGMMTDRDFARMPVLEAQLLFEDKRLGASNIGSINVHDTQLGICVTYRQMRPGAPLAMMNRGFINASSNRSG
ncbi:hypothetical protein I6F33_25700 [Bradyrhizobium sp. BRP20]|uniref:hypothetical protein n=1 Tax=Bradyrhizobium sp. BRP20 TaxID=2793822 RepID=UPI001CD54BDD|nr:hypothetical protein [Bradyrhizobium sp. BRP20]MCA1436351.1 hypothetical protein [Bradyrhizobium sp. BRP20]